MRLKELEDRQKKEDAGKEVPGVFSAHKVAEQIRLEVRDVQTDRAEARREMELVSKVCLLEPEKPAQLICGAWKTEHEGWIRIDCVMDSGAAESVCPHGMIGHIEVVDSPGSKAGQHYLAANGGRIANRGQQLLPCMLGNGDITEAVFQVADVSRPLMSVSKVCEAGNRVIFGQSGGVILNLSSGKTTVFEMKDGVYVFPLWIPGLSLAGSAPFARRP